MAVEQWRRGENFISFISNWLNTPERNADHLPTSFVHDRD